MSAYVRIIALCIRTRLQRHYSMGGRERLPFTQCWLYLPEKKLARWMAVTASGAVCDDSLSSQPASQPPGHYFRSSRFPPPSDRRSRCVSGMSRIRGKSRLESRLTAGEFSRFDRSLYPATSATQGSGGDGKQRNSSRLFIHLESMSPPQESSCDERRRPTTTGKDVFAPTRTRSLR